MLQIYLLGPFRLLQDDQPLRLPKRRDTARLWAYLLLHAGEPQQRDSIAETLWPESAQARFSLRHNLHALKAFLPEADADQPWLLVDKDTLAWNPQAPARTDLQVFSTGLTPRSNSGGDTSDLEGALGAYSGELLAGWDDAWIADPRERLARQFRGALERLIVLSRESGARDRALAFAERLLAAEPYVEASHRLLIACLLDVGDQEGARARAAALRTMLREEFASTPEADTLQLLKALEPGTDSSDPSLSSRAAPAPSRTNPVALPRFPGPFIDDGARSLMATEVAPGGLTCLWGPPGAGKSRLAAELCAARRTEWPGGQLWLDLAADSGGSSLVAALASGLDLPGIGEGDLEGLLSTLPARLERPTLVVIDNADRFLTEMAVLARRLLPLARNLGVLVTSRERVGIGLEQARRVRLLDLPIEGAASAVGASESLSLLLAGLSRLGFDRQPTREWLALLAAAARAADGLPEVLLRIAAASGGPMGERNLADIVDGRLEVLEESAPIDGLRHRGLMDSVAWNLDALSLSAQLLFERLALFSGRFAVAEVERLCSGDLGSGIVLEQDVVLEAMQELEAASLLQVDGIAKAERHRLLGPLRWVAWRRAERRGEAQALGQVGLDASRGSRSGP